MSQFDFTGVSSKANEVWTEAIDKALAAFALVSEVQREVSGRTVDVNAAIAREGVQYLDEVQGTIRRASEETRALLNRQWEVAEELPKDPTAFPQKVVSLYWSEGEKFANLGDAQLEAMTRYTGNLQNLLERAGKETRESLTKYTEKILSLYGLKN